MRTIPTASPKVDPSPARRLREPPTGAKIRPIVRLILAGALLAGCGSKTTEPEAPTPVLASGDLVLSGPCGIVVIDPETRSTWLYPRTVACGEVGADIYMPDSRHMFRTRYGGGTAFLEFYDLNPLNTDAQPVMRIDGERPTIGRLLPAGDSLFWTYTRSNSWDGAMTLLDLRRGAYTKVYGLGDSLSVTSMDWGPDGLIYLLMNGNGGSVRAYDPKTNTSRRVSGRGMLPGELTALVVTPSGMILVAGYVDEPASIYAVDAATGEQRVVATSNLLPLGTAFMLLEDDTHVLLGGAGGDVSGVVRVVRLDLSTGVVTSLAGWSCGYQLEYPCGVGGAAIVPAPSSAQRAGGQPPASPAH